MSNTVTMTKDVAEKIIAAHSQGVPFEADMLAAAKAKLLEPEPAAQAPAMSPADMLVELERLRAENARLASRTTAQGTLAVSMGEKLNVKVTGLGRFPVTLYANQWLKLIAFLPKVQEYIEANRSKLSWTK